MQETTSKGLKCFTEIIQGKLDQRGALLEVDTTIGRDIRKEDISTISLTLESWCDACENILSTLQTQVDKANSEKTRKIQRKEELEQQVRHFTCLSWDLIAT